MAMCPFRLERARASLKCFVKFLGKDEKSFGKTVNLMKAALYKNLKRFWELGWIGTI